MKSDATLAKRTIDSTDEPPIEEDDEDDEVATRDAGQDHAKDATHAKRHSPPKVDRKYAKKTKISQSRDSHITRLLLITNFVLLICALPKSVHLMVFRYIDIYSTPKVFGDFILTSQFNSKLHLSMHAIDFYLYLLLSNQFRRDQKSASLLEMVPKEHHSCLV